MKSRITPSIYDLGSLKTIRFFIPGSPWLPVCQGYRDALQTGVRPRTSRFWFRIYPDPQDIGGPVKSEICLTWSNLSPGGTLRASPYLDSKVRLSIHLIASVSVNFPGISWWRASASGWAISTPWNSTGQGIFCRPNESMVTVLGALRAYALTSTESPAGPVSGNKKVAPAQRSAVPLRTIRTES